MRCLPENWLFQSTCLATEPFMFLFMFVYGAHLSVVPQLLLNKVCNTKFDSSTCDNLDLEKFSTAESVVHEEAAKWNMYFYLALTIPSIFTCVLTGYLYDVVLKAGTILLFPSTLSLQAIVYIISSSYAKLHVGFLILGPAITSLCGDLQGAILVASAFMADITAKDENRLLRITFVECSLFTGIATGSLVSGFLLEKYGYAAVFWTSLAMSITNFIYVAILLQIHPTKVKKNLPSVSKSALKTFLSNNLKKERLAIFVPILLAVLFTTMTMGGENQILVLYIKHQPLSLSPSQVGIYLTILHLARAAGTVLFSVLYSRFSSKGDYVLAAFGLVSMTAFFATLSQVRSTLALYLTSVISLLIPLPFPAFRTIASKMASEEEQGLTLSAVAVLGALGFSIAAFTTNPLYEATSSSHPGLVMVLLASSAGAALLITVIVYSQAHWKTLNEQISTSEHSPKSESKHLLHEQEAE